ncbi:zinc dependent phospholipase C family protein [Anaerolineales bacterium HSG25]|nr:zinc dependent phospholipase C family protein [Anaerolineales bacterium HSG25]
MAPFNTHFLIAEHVWSDLNGPWQNEYGSFCFGCVAPDVDKISTTLTQKDTHFFDRSGDYELMVTHRSATFLAQQDQLLGGRFIDLSPSEQAFVLGYLCHLAVDEVSKHLWRREGTWDRFHDVSIGSAFAAIDEQARQMTQNYPRIVAEICAISPPTVLTHVSPADLTAMFDGICLFARATDTKAEYLALLKAFWHIATPKKRQQKTAQFQIEIKAAREQIHYLQLDRLVALSVNHSHQRLQALIKGKPVAVGYPF